MRLSDREDMPHPFLFLELALETDPIMKERYWNFVENDWTVFETKLKRLCRGQMGPAWRS